MFQEAGLLDKNYTLKIKYATILAQRRAKTMERFSEIYDFNELVYKEEQLSEEIRELESKLNLARKQLTKQLKRERSEALKPLKKELRKIEKRDSASITKKLEEIANKRKELYAKRDLVLEMLAKEQLATREEMQRLEEEYQEVAKVLKGTNELRKNKTNEEYLNLIIKALEENGSEDYAIRIFNKDFTYVGIGTHSDYPQYSTIRSNGVVAIAKNGLDISKIPEEVISYPEEHETFYIPGDFILFQKLETPVEENPNFFTKMSYINSELPGMNAELTARINNNLLEEYRNSARKQNQKVNK